FFRIYVAGALRRFDGSWGGPSIESHNECGAVLYTDAICQSSSGSGVRFAADDDAPKSWGPGPLEDGNELILLLHKHSEPVGAAFVLERSDLYGIHGGAGCRRCHDIAGRIENI